MGFSERLTLSKVCVFSDIDNDIVRTTSFSNLSTLETVSKVIVFKATFHLAISMRGQRVMGKIQRSCGPSLTGKTSSVSFIFTHGTHWNVKNR